MTVRPGEYPIEIRAGQSYRKTFTWYPGTTVVNGVYTLGTPADLTGASAILRAKVSSDSPSAFLELTTENGGIALGGAAGTITLTISKTATALMTKNGLYELRITYANGLTDWLFFGSLTVIRGAT